MNVQTYPHLKLATRGTQGKTNGYLVPIYNEHESPIQSAQKPCQVYLTVVAPGAIKGPHLHMQRWGLFTCIKGNIKIIVKTPQGYEDYYSGEDHEYKKIQVPAGWAAALHNQGSTESFVLNMPSPAWTPENQDDHQVSFADYKF